MSDTNDTPPETAQPGEQPEQTENPLQAGHSVVENEEDQYEQGELGDEDAGPEE